MKLSQLIESFVISNDEFEDYLNRATEQLTQELQSGKNPRDAVHDLALTFADQHNKSYDAYTRMSDSLSARMHTLELDGSTSTEIAPADMTNGPEMSDMGAEPEMMTDPMGDMEMETPAQDEMPGDSDMEDYAAVMDNEPEVEESYSPGDENEEGMVSNCCGAPIMDVYQGHGRCSDCKEMASAERVEETVNEDPSKPSFPQTVELAGDSIWDRETPNPQSVTVTDYEMEEEDGYVHVKVMHDGPWTIYTDTGFEKAISEMIGMKVTFTEQGMQQEGVASLEGGTDMDEEINILKRNAGV